MTRHGQEEAAAEPGKKSSMRRAAATRRQVALQRRNVKIFCASAGKVFTIQRRNERRKKFSTVMLKTLWKKGWWMVLSARESGA
jgi:hypothetical protein